MVSVVWIQQSLHGFDKVSSPITLFISYMTYTNSLYMRTTAPIFQMLVIIRIAHTFLYCDILTHVVIFLQSQPTGEKEEKKDMLAC